ncbi:winged helix-turn-helix domain-containing protein [Yersinia proxima]|uniref:winged helix-turn-helix domain-containing protein n=1 Tax=Yersinia proxima TaxID=2890316 RepID=UPI003D68C964
MNKCYVIDDVAIFFPEEKAIMSSVSGNKIKLNAPTSQLLEAFIHNIGNTISQNDLYTIVWGDNGASVTPNTLYQNISLLRKALKDSGIAGESLTTIRGKGFIFVVSSIFEKEFDNVKNTDVAMSIPRVNYKALLSFATVIALIISVFFVFLKKNTTVGYNFSDHILLDFNKACGISDVKNDEDFEKS